MADEPASTTPTTDNGGDNRLNALEAKMNGVADNIGKLVDVISSLQKTPADSGKQNPTADDLKDQPVEKRIESLTATIDVLAGAVNKIVSERNAEQQAAAAVAAAQRDNIIDQVAKALPEFENRKDDLKAVPLPVLEMMLKRQANNKSADPMAPVSSKVKPLTLEEAGKIAAERKKSQKDTLLSLSAFGRR